MAGLINPDPDQIEAHRSEMAEGKSHALGYVAGYMNAWVVTTSEMHAEECVLDPCTTCQELGRALSLYAAYELEYPPPPEVLEERARRLRGEE